jgi:hypothetical protein
MEMKAISLFSILTIALLVSCSPSTPESTTVPITIQYSSATTPWLKNLYTCAGNHIVSSELRAADFQDLQSVDLVMRIGQPVDNTAPTYQLGTDELLVIVNRQNPANKLTKDQVDGLFSGRIPNWTSIQGSDAPVQVWVYSTGEDIQQVFNQSLLGGSLITSQARVANNPDEMSRAISNDVNAIGILTRRWKTGNTTEVFTAAGSLPVLAFTRVKPQGVLAQILACMQK